MAEQGGTRGGLFGREEGREGEGGSRLGALGGRKKPPLGEGEAAFGFPLSFVRSRVVVAGSGGIPRWLAVVGFMDFFMGSFSSGFRVFF